MTPNQSLQGTFDTPPDDNGGKPRLPRESQLSE